MSTEVSTQAGDIVVIAGMFKEITIELLHSFGDNPVGLLIWCFAWIAVAFMIFMRGPARKMVETLRVELDNLKDELHTVKSGQEELKEAMTSNQTDRMTALSDIKAGVVHLSERLDATYDRFADKDTTGARFTSLEKAITHFTDEVVTVLTALREMSQRGTSPYDKD